MTPRSDQPDRSRHEARSRKSIWFARIAGAVLVSIGFLGTFVPTAIAEPSATYEVKPGDTLSGIAQEYGVSVSAVARSNGVSNPNVLRAGQVLKIEALTSTLSPPFSAALMPAPYF